MSMKLTKYMSREHSLFYAHTWNEANKNGFDEYMPETNIKDMVFLLNKSGVLEVYYNLDELETVFTRIVNEINKDSKILDTILSQFYYYWERLLPYILQENKIESTDELKGFYQNWIKWWTPMAYIFVIPDREHIADNLRKKALKAREETQEYSDEGDRVFTEFIKKRYPKHDDVATLLTPNEAFRFKELSQKEIHEIKKRSGGYALSTIGGETSLDSLDELYKKLIQNNITLENPKSTEDKEIKGTVASPGKVVGNVRLVLTKLALQDVKESEIMVTYATSPDYVPAMKRAAAIVTNEGGITCHAAIVSRELNKPCIIGTKIATQVLKDGDLVEVDADKGVVRIIK